MARTVKDQTLDSRAARGRLAARGKPYWRLLEEGLHLGYRKPAGGKAGKWVLRHYVGAQRYEVQTIAAADDLTDADGVAILNFKQAQAAAREQMKQRAAVRGGKGGPYRVRDAIAEYLDFLDHNRKSGSDARYRAEAFVLPRLGDIEADTLTTEAVHKWHIDLAKAAPRLRTKPGKKQRHREVSGDEESKRRRRSTANRTLTVLKAALNRAWRAGKIGSDAAWRRVEPFEGVDAARLRYLSLEESKRLVNAADPAFRPLVRAALLTGCRYGELTALTVADFNRDAGTIAIRTSKSGLPRHVVLTEEGAAFFAQVCAGRAGSDLMFKHANGSAWAKSDQSRPMKAACKAAKISPLIGIHGLRHTWASHAVMNGVPLLIVAKNLGHSDTRMVERHYGHLAPSYVADAIRAGAPKFGFDVDDKVVEIRSR